LIKAHGNVGNYIRAQNVDFFRKPLKSDRLVEHDFQPLGNSKIKSDNRSQAG